MVKYIKSYLYLIIYLIIGLAIVVLFDKIKLPLWLHKSAAILIVFILLNVCSEIILKLNAIKEYWAIKKLWHFIPAAIAGAVIALLPQLLALAFGQLKQPGLQFNFTTSLPAIIITFIIVGWEELWFRSVILNYCSKHLSTLNISLTIGLLFMLMHALNPEIVLSRSGPALFFAGALLALLYLHYRSIWVPWGLHFGNNFFGHMIKTQNDNDIFFGSDGYLSAIILATIFIYFAFKNKKKGVTT